MADCEDVDMDDNNVQCVWTLLSSEQGEHYVSVQNMAEKYTTGKLFIKLPVANGDCREDIECYDSDSNVHSAL